MRILFVQKRYHSNQHYAMKSLLDRGHEVLYLVQDIGPSENYGVITPKRIPYSSFFLIKEQVHKLTGRDLSRAKDGVPSLLRLYGVMRRFNPDVVIVKKFRQYSRAAAKVARLLDKPVVLYNQKPLTEVSDSPEESGVEKSGSKPRVSFSPTSGVLSGEKPYKKGNAYYIPLVIELSPLERVRSYKQDGAVRIISVGKYSNMWKKRHDLLLQAFSEVAVSCNVSLTFVGSGRENEPKLLQLKQMVAEMDLEDRVDFRLNIPHKEMIKVYAEHDLFVLPSCRESYGYSVLEAMAGGLPVIASDRAGAGDCISGGINGYIFKSNDLDSLTSAIGNIVKDRDKLEKMGEESRRIVREGYLPHMYHDRLMELLKQEFSLS